MRLDVLEHKSTFVGLSLALTPADIDVMLRQLNALKNDNSQHFHLSNNADTSSVFVDIEIGFEGPSEPSNGVGFGFAIAPTDTD